MDERRNEIDWARLERLVTRQGTAQELEALQRWVDADPELQKIVAAMRTIGTPSDLKDRPWDDQQAWTRLRERMHAVPVRPLQVHRATPSSMQRVARTPGRRSVFTSSRTYFAAAAAIVIVVTGSLLLTTVRRSDSRATLASAPAGPVREIATRRGEQATIDLVDGTHVILAPGSRLSIPAEFSAAKSRIRELRLEGEAHFAVAHDSSRPFRVATSTAVTEDIGTAFVISSFPEDKGTRVVVAEGSVAMIPTGRQVAATQRTPIALVAGQLGQLDSAGTVTRKNVDVAAYVAWTQGTVVFDGARLSTAIPQLERWFDLNISLADSSLANRRLTGSFAHGSSDVLLQELSIALDVKVKRSGQSVVLTARRK